MKLSETKNQLDSEIKKTSSTEINSPEIQEYKDGKWVSVNIDPNTYYYLLEIKKRLAQMNIRVSRNDIVKRLLLLGTDNLSLEVLLENPLALWSNQVEEELI